MICEKCKRPCGELRPGSEVYPCICDDDPVAGILQIIKNAIKSADNMAEVVRDLKYGDISDALNDLHDYIEKQYGKEVK